MLPVKRVPVPPDPEIIYVPADPVTSVSEPDNASRSVDITPLSNEFGRFDDTAGVNEPLVTLVTNKVVPPFWK